MTTVIYHNPSCSTSREAMKVLKEQQEDIQVIEYLKNTPTRTELKALLLLLKIKPELLVRKKEKIYKELLAGKEYSDDQWIDLLVQYPVLIERPIVVKNGKAAIGRPIQQIIDIL